MLSGRSGHLRTSVEGLNHQLFIIQEAAEREECLLFPSGGE